MATPYEVFRLIYPALTGTCQPRLLNVSRAVPGAANMPRVAWGVAEYWRNFAPTECGSIESAAAARDPQP